MTYFQLYSGTGIILIMCTLCNVQCIPIIQVENILELNVLKSISERNQSQKLKYKMGENVF